MNISMKTLRPFALIVSLLVPALSASAQAQRAPAPAASAAPAAPSGVVNINTASVEELSRLPGVGPSRAQAIVDLRTRNKGFKKTEELMRVKGIGRKTFRKLEPMLRLQGPTTLAAQSASRPAPSKR